MIDLAGDVGQSRFGGQAFIRSALGRSACQSDDDGTPIESRSMAASPEVSGALAAAGANAFVAAPRVQGGTMESYKPIFRDRNARPTPAREV